jgi:cytochrome c biogenesis protein ResB
MIEILIAIIIGTVLDLLFFFVGYWAGRSKNIIEDAKTAAGQIAGASGAIVNKIANPPIHTGKLDSPTAREMIIKNDIQRSAGLQEMKKTLDNIPELNKIKEKVVDLKKRGLYE